jgi:hypothetical protein
MHSILEILEESTASAGPDLISLADLKLALGITDNSEDAELQAAITFQSRIITEYCNRRFGFAEVLETFTFDRYETMLTRQALTLSLYPIVELIEVSSAGATAADYDFDPASGRVWFANYWANPISVVYSGGYNLPEQAPARLQQAVIMAVNGGRVRSERDPTLRALQHGDIRIEYLVPATVIEAALLGGGGLSQSIIDLIKPFRRLHVA